MSRKLDKVSNQLESDDYIEVDGLYKPKGMHWRTFYRLKMAEIATDDQMNKAFMAKFECYM